MALLVSVPPATRAEERLRLEQVFPTNFWHSLSGVTFRDGAMWAVGKGNVLLRYDPSTGDLLEEVDPMLPGMGHSHIHSIARDDEGLYWVGEVYSRQLFRLRFSDHSVVSVLPFPENPTPVFGMTFDRGKLWVGYHSAGPAMPIHGVDPESGQILEVIEPGTTDAHGLAWVGDYLWVLDNHGNTLYQVDAAGQMRNSFPLPPDTWASLAFDGTRFWTSNLYAFFHIEVPPSTQCPPPGEVRDVAFTDDTSLIWGEPPWLGGGPVSYDTMRSGDPSDFETLATCVESHDSDRSATDADTPPPGDVHYYLIRAENPCPDGPGSLGVSSNGTARAGATCP